MLQCLADSIRPDLITLEESMKLLSGLSIPIYLMAVVVSTKCEHIMVFIWGEIPVIHPL